MSEYESDSDTLDTLGITEETESTINTCKDVEKDFCDAILKAKFSLYENITIAPKLGTSLAQDPKLNDEFLKQLMNFFIIIRNIFNNIPNKDYTFPPGSMEYINNAINISTKYKNQTSPEFRNVYTNYTTHHLKENQYMDKNMEEHMNYISYHLKNPFVLK